MKNTSVSTLDRFNDLKLTVAQMKSVVGGKKAFCTDGDHAACYLIPIQL